ncbi:MAG: hypothetical protein ACK4TC_07420 [Sphingomonas pseudosanguinis]|uniref:hypothetical protein n=1 Tax=Sphingomonas pseudosanguinis TaxID=413712 RepID=UPI00391A88B8
MSEDFGLDLFGDPVLPTKEARGRPEHSWSLENSNKVLLAFAMGRSEKEAATAIGISVPTLRKHYFSEVAKRKDAKLRMEMTQLSRLNSAAADGNVTAEKELFKRLDKAAIEQLADRVVERGRQSKAPKGKKVAEREAAQEAVKKYQPRQGPALLN